jgi:hypothetical protein
MRGSESWWAGRHVQTDDGEQGIILDRARALRRLSRRQLARMILEKDYLEVVKWDDGKLELVHENYLLDPETHTWAPVVQLRPGHPGPRLAAAALGVAFASAAGAAGGYALSVGLPQQVISSASSAISPSQEHRTSPTGGSSGLATNSQHVPSPSGSTACPVPSGSQPTSPQPTSLPSTSPRPSPRPTTPLTSPTTSPPSPQPSPTISPPSPPPTSPQPSPTISPSSPQPTSPQPTSPQG